MTPPLILATCLALALLMLAGVSSYGRLARRVSGQPSQASPVIEGQTRIDRVIEPLLRGRAGLSGVALLIDNVEAFAMRAACARQAGRSLDLQYYYWRDDLTGGLLAREIIAAADRGVRVRILIDDISMRGRDRFHRAIDCHPGIEIRLFNPSRNRSNGFKRGLELLARFVTATRRMHNKAWIADGRIAIIGGRNIGDAYFDAAKDSNFHDMDVLAIGEALTSAQAIFDEYWNSAAAIPIRSLYRRRIRMMLDEVRRRYEALATSPAATPYLAHLRERGSEMPLLPKEPLRWVERVEVVSDKPDKALGRNDGNLLARRIRSLIATARSRVRIISPYFIPGHAGVASLSGLAAGGVDVAVLTNSLAATDVVAVHGAYARYRKPLLQARIALYELRPEQARERLSLFGSKGASLHTKAFSIDGEIAFVGSFNFDPRSVSLNTEMGVIVHDSDLAARIDAHFIAQTDTDSAFRITLHDGALRWSEPPPTPPTHVEPAASLSRRFAAACIGWLPIESQL